MARSAERAPFSEREAVALLARAFGAPSTRGNSARVELGIGDDAALLRPARGESLVWTSDASVQGVHFDLRWLTLEDVGFRSFQAAASDLAAMGARPIAALSNLILPASFDRPRLAELVRGQRAAARALRCPIIGGNLARGGELSVTSTVLGGCRRALLRSGARAGHELWLVGDAGLAAAGLELLRRGKRVTSAAARRCVTAWRRPRVLLARVLALNGRASAALDLSDGLRADAPRLAEASGVRVVIESEALGACLAPELQAIARGLGSTALELALLGGEDYALLAAGPHSERPRWARRIGRVETGSGALFETAAGELLPLLGGFDHLAGAVRSPLSGKRRASRRRAEPR